MNTNVNNEKILDSIAMGIFTIDMDWNITYFNSEAEKITGFVKKEAWGVSVMKFSGANSVLQDVI